MGDSSAWGPRQVALAQARPSGGGDLDGDGRQDMVLNNIDSKPTILSNVTAPAGHWLEVRLIGDIVKKSPRDSVGTYCVLDHRQSTTASGRG